MPCGVLVPGSDVSQGNYDDADHIKSPVDSSMTLCGQQAWRVLNALNFDDPRPNGAEACWTCLKNAEGIDARSR
jgi:hypothetical protein